MHRTPDLRSPISSRRISRAYREKGRPGRCTSGDGSAQSPSESPRRNFPTGAEDVSLPQSKRKFPGNIFHDAILWQPETVFDRTYSDIGELSTDANRQIVDLGRRYAEIY
jgi:hypothetical protein